MSVPAKVWLRSALLIVSVRRCASFVVTPGGCLSIAEPMLHRWKAAQFPDTEETCAKSPIANYSERDLLNMVSGAGFAQIHLHRPLGVSAGAKAFFMNRLCPATAQLPRAICA